MSHETGIVFSADGKQRLAWFEHNGTSEVVISCLHDGPPTDVDDGTFFSGPTCKWRNHKWNNCTCGEPPIDVLFFAGSWGSGTYWPGRACLKCRAAVQGLMPYDSMSCGERMCDKYGCDHIRIDMTLGDDWPECVEAHAISHIAIFGEWKK
jgi:hypothetical protein